MYRNGQNVCMRAAIIAMVVLLIPLLLTPLLMGNALAIISSYIALSPQGDYALIQDLCSSVSCTAITSSNALAYEAIPSMAGTQAPAAGGQIEKADGFKFMIAMVALSTAYLSGRKFRG